VAVTYYPPFLYLKQIFCRREATANERASRAEEKVAHLTKKFGKLIREKGRAGFLLCISQF
jgi:hypothetical protein